jgi:hypothetical protein
VVWLSAALVDSLLLGASSPVAQTLFLALFVLNWGFISSDETPNVVDVGRQCASAANKWWKGINRAVDAVESDAALQSAIPTIVMTCGGEIIDLGPLDPSTSLLQVKQKVSERSEMTIRSHQLVLVDDTRSDEDDLNLKDEMLLSEVQVWAESKEELSLCVLVDLKRDAAEVLRALPVSPSPSTIITTGKACNFDDQPAHEAVSQKLCECHCAIRVPAHQHIVIVTGGRHEVCVYDCWAGNKLLCKVGKEDGTQGGEEGEFNGPWGLAVTADSSLVVVSDHYNHRLQVFTLAVAADGSTAHLNFVRTIGAVRELTVANSECHLCYPAGLAVRAVGKRSTVLVADWLHHRIAEFDIDGPFVRSIGSAVREHVEGVLSNPIDVTVLPLSGMIAVADEHKVSIFDGESGDFREELRGSVKPVKPCAIAADAHDQLLVLERESSALMLFNADGEHLFTRQGDLGILSRGYKGIAWYDEGCLLIANGGAHNAMIFLPQ